MFSLLSVKSSTTIEKQNIIASEDRVKKLPSVLQNLIFMYLTPEEFARTGCVNKNWKIMSHHEETWKNFYQGRYSSFVYASTMITWSHKFRHNEKEVYKLWIRLFDNKTAADMIVKESLNEEVGNHFFKKMIFSTDLFVDVEGNIMGLGTQPSQGIFNREKLFCLKLLLDKREIVPNANEVNPILTRNIYFRIAHEIQTEEGFVNKKWTLLGKITNKSPRIRKYFSEDQSEKLFAKISCLVQGLNARVSRITQKIVDDNLKILSANSSLKENVITEEQVNQIDKVKSALAYYFCNKWGRLIHKDNRMIGHAVVQFPYQPSRYIDSSIYQYLNYMGNDVISLMRSMVKPGREGQEILDNLNSLENVMKGNLALKTQNIAVISTVIDNSFMPLSINDRKLAKKEEKEEKKDEVATSKS